MVIDDFRKPGQGGYADDQPRDLRAELLAAEAANQTKKNGTHVDEASGVSPILKRPLQLEQEHKSAKDEDPATKRIRILEETREIDEDSDGVNTDSSEEESEEEDETAELMRELEKIKRERAEEKAKEVRRAPIARVADLMVHKEAAKAVKEEEERGEEIALGNPLLNPKAFNVKRRWDDDVIFKNQARGTEQKGKKEFVNV